MIKKNLRHASNPVSSVKNFYKSLAPDAPVDPDNTRMVFLTLFISASSASLFVLIIIRILLFQFCFFAA